MTPEKEIDHEYTDDAVCPHCGHVERDSWELPGDGEQEMEHDCGSCGETFEYCRSITVEFVTWKKPKN